MFIENTVYQAVDGSQLVFIGPGPWSNGRILYSRGDGTYYRLNSTDPYSPEADWYGRKIEVTHPKFSFDNTTLVIEDLNKRILDGTEYVRQPQLRNIDFGDPDPPPVIYDVQWLLGSQRTAQSGSPVGKPMICITRLRSDWNGLDFVISFFGDEPISEQAQAVNGQTDVSDGMLFFKTQRGDLDLPPSWLIRHNPKRYYLYWNGQPLARLSVHEYDIVLNADGSVSQVTKKRQFAAI